MNTRIALAALLLSCLHAAVLPPAHAADVSFARTRLVTQPSARHTKTTRGVLTVEESAGKLTFMDGTQTAVAVPFTQITSMRLEQTTDRIRAPFTGRVQHDEFLTLVYQDEAGKSEYAVFHLEERSYRGVVAALEAQTKKQVEWTTN